MICEIHTETAQNRAELYGAEEWCTDYHDLLSRADIDAVIVCSPDSLHHQMAADLLDAGKHVLCEKPLTLHNAQSQIILDAEKRSHAKFMVSQVCRKTPAFILAKQRVDQGVIGELTYVESEYGHGYSVMGVSGRNDPSDPHHIVTGARATPWICFAELRAIRKNRLRMLTKSTLMTLGQRMIPPPPY